jgi:hypothetical protein
LYHFVGQMSYYKTTSLIDSYWSIMISDDVIADVNLLKQSGPNCFSKSMSAVTSAMNGGHQ